MGRAVLSQAAARRAWDIADRTLGFYCKEKWLCPVGPLFNFQIKSILSVYSTDRLI